MKLLVGNLPFYKIQVDHFMTRDDSSGAKIIPKDILWMRGLVPFWVLTHSFLSLTDCWWLYNIQLGSRRGVLFVPPSDAYVRSFLYFLYTLIKLCYTKALSNQVLSLAPGFFFFFFTPEAKNPVVLLWFFFLLCDRQQPLILGVCLGIFRTR